MCCQKWPDSKTPDANFAPKAQAENNKHMIYGCLMFWVAKKKHWFIDKDNASEGVEVINQVWWSSSNFSINISKWYGYSSSK